MYRNVNITVNRADGDTLSQSESVVISIRFVTAFLIGRECDYVNNLKPSDSSVSECKIGKRTDAAVLARVKLR